MQPHGETTRRPLVQMFWVTANVTVRDRGENAPSRRVAPSL